VKVEKKIMNDVCGVVYKSGVSVSVQGLEDYVYNNDKGKMELEAQLR